MTNAINQHWVPRFYLKEFSTPETKNTKEPKVRIFSKIDGDPKIVNVKNIAAKRYLYSPKDDKGSRSWVTEDKLAKLESIVSSIWPSFANNFVDLGSDSIRKCVSLFLATLILRHPSNLHEYRIIQNKMIEYFDGLPKDDEGRPKVNHIETPDGTFEFDVSNWNEYSKPTDYDREIFFVEQINREAINVAKILMEKRWSVLFSDESGFITTDRPVSIFNQDKDKFGVSSKGTFIKLPISPTRVLILDDRFQEPGSRYYPLSEQGHGPANLTSWIHAHRFMITGRDTDEVCEEMLSLEAHEGGNA